MDEQLATASRERRPATRACAQGASVLLGLVVLFQLALVFGAPWGEATQGGRADTVDGALVGGARLLAGISAAMLIAAILVVRARAGLMALGRDGVARTGTWAVVVFLGLNTLGNLAGRHPFERWVMGAVSAVAMALVLCVASGEGVSERTGAAARRS
jgi:hypothetical protein